MYKYIATLSLFLLFSHTTSKAGLIEAYKAYDSEQYQVAFDEFRSLAEIGHKVGQYNLGHLYLEGKGVQQNLVKSYAWIKLSETNEGEHSKVLDTINGHLSTDQIKSAQQLLEELRVKYSRESLKEQLEPILVKNTLQQKDQKPYATPIKQQPASYPKEAQYKGYEGWVIFGFKINEEGRPVDIRVEDSYPAGVFEKNALKAVNNWVFELEGKPFEKVVRYKLSFQVANDNRNNRKLIASLKEKALAGDASAQYYYAKLRPEVIVDGEFNPTEWYYESALQGNAMAQYELADNLLHGKGCEKDTDKAINWLINSATNDLGRSQFKLAKIFYEEGDLDKGRFWLAKAIKSNDQEVLFDIALYIDNNTLEGFSEKVILQILPEVNIKLMGNPISYYGLYAKAYAGLGDYKNAVKYQQKSHSYYRKVGRVPESKKELLASYEASYEASLDS